MTIPTLTPLPDPPLPTDPEALFDTKAGNSLAAQKSMVDELNSSFGWVESQVEEINAIRAAAGLPPALATLHALALSF
ncbi:hypothetical protein [Pseudomonas putida]|uniref:hypothetical protein n=1 Tax=Pseudomonas putida TaxID=303 RepID=UPI00062A15E3|nr:hypothetical protein [Pseudomonas putida]